MNFFYLLLTVSLILSGCKSGEQSRKESNKELAKQEKKLVRQELEKEKQMQEKKSLEQERLAKEQEEKQVKEELERKKIESEKQKDELRKVHENLKRMGLAAIRIDAVKEGNLITYSDGRTVTTTGSVTDRGMLMTLDELLKKALDNERKKTNAEPVCAGGFETCQNGVLYVYIMRAGRDAACTGEWFRTEQECK